MNEMEQLISQYQNQSQRIQEINDVKNAVYDGVHNINVDFKELDEEKFKIAEERYKTGTNITKKVFSVKIMNDYEKAKAKGAKETLKFISKYLTVNTGLESAIQTFKSSNVSEKIKGILGVSLVGFVTLMSLPITSPLLIGFVLFKSGKSALELYNQIKSAPEVQSELKKLGKYDIIMENLEKIVKNKMNEKDVLYGSDKQLATHLIEEEGRKLV